MGKQALDSTGVKWSPKTMAMVDPEDVVVIGWDTDDGPEHELYDERAKLPLDEQLIENIMLHGVLENIIVRKNGEKIEVHVGRQRVKNCREANKRLKKAGKEPHRITCEVRKGKVGDMLGVSISENELRKGDPLTVKAAKLERYLQTGKTEEEAAIVYGVSLQSIRNWRKINDLDASVVKAIDSGKVKGSSAWNLASLPREEQKTELEKMLASGGRVTANRTRGAAKKKRTGEDDFKPGKRVVNKVLRLNEQSEVLTADFVRGVCWVLGDVNPRTVKGLTELINEATGDKE